MDNENRTTTDGLPPDPGMEHAPAPKPIGPNGQHTAYWILSEEERSKGFIRPLRHSYTHVGKEGPKYPLRDLTPEEETRYKDFKYIKYEEYPKGESSVVGRFWTQADLDRVGNGCGSTTTMSRPIAETYARDPHFYGATFCVACRTHLPLEEFIWLDGSRMGS